MGGEPLAQASGAVVLVHGRGATAESMLPLAAELEVPGFAWLAPQAANGAWYPHSFLAPLASNEPGLSSGLAAIADVLRRLEEADIGSDRTLLLGFSQGACLTLEYGARNARRYGGLAGLSGGLIGPPGTPRAYAASLARTPVFVGCSDVDPHIPAERVRESARVLRDLGGEVTERLYPGMPHTVNADEIRVVRGMLEAIAHGLRSSSTDSVTGRVAKT
ncbi:MAG: phospholipase [Gemmatimonadetes bacterium]|nr:phospholipase [Gemmatimonadota bacterium]